MLPLLHFASAASEAPPVELSRTCRWNSYDTNANPHLVFFDDFEDNDISDWVAGGYRGNDWTTKPSVSGGRLLDPVYGLHTIGRAMHRSITLGSAFRINMTGLAALHGIGPWGSGYSAVGVTIYSDYNEGSEDGYMFELVSKGATHYILKIRNGAVVGTILSRFFGDQANDAGPWRFERDADGYWSMYSNRINTSGGFDMEFTTFVAIDVIIWDESGHPAYIDDIHVYDLAPLEYSLTIATTVGGTTNPAPGTYNCTSGTVVAVNATSHANYVFDHWMLDGDSSTSNPINVTMNADRSLQAFFTPTYTLTITATAGGTTDPIPGTYVHSSGKVVDVTASPDAGYYFDHWELDGVNVGRVNPISIIMNKDYALYAESKVLPHDVAVEYVESPKEVVFQGFKCCDINVAVADLGSYTETFNVTAYATNTATGNATILATFLNVTLVDGTFTSLAFDWNTTGFAKGNYAISAYAEPVQNETDTTNNNFTDGWIIVAMIGDITGRTGYPDGKVDARDVAGMCWRYGAQIGDPQYDPNWDPTGQAYGVPDGKIDARDVSLVASRYGQKDP